MAIRALATLSDVVEPPMWRRWIPVRSRIQSSEVSIVLDNSSFVTTRSGSAMPQPVKRAPRDWEGINGIE